jgi:uncharacterized protein YdeI (YjbR/CyaY-like superfamily)
MPAKSDLPIMAFASAREFELWLGREHARSSGSWLKFAKKSSGHETVSVTEAIDIALCYGWIDGQLATYDTSFWLVRYTPRGPKSAWSQINRDRVARLIEAGRMQPAGLAAVELAQADGRWDRAYQPQRNSTVPPDFQAALDANPKAAAFFATLKGSNRYAVLYRVQDAKRVETRARRIEQFVERLAGGETL